MQGYYFLRPAPLEEVYALIAKEAKAEASDAAKVESAASV